MNRFIQALVLMLFVSVLSAHNLRCFPVVSEDGLITVRCFFRIGQPAENVNVTISDAQGAKVFEGRTNAKGLTTFTWKGPGPLTVVAFDQAGHRVERILQAHSFANISLNGQDLAEPAPSHEKVAALHQRIQELETEVESLRSQSAVNEWLRAGLGIVVMLAIAAIGWLVSRRRKQTHA